MKSNLSHILPVWKACEILGQPTVYRIISSLIRLKESTTAVSNSSYSGGTVRQVPTTTASEEDIKTLCNALFYQPKTNDDYIADPLSGNTADNTIASLPDGIVNAWKKWLTHPSLIIDQKSTFIQFVVPSTVQPHPGPTGHMGLFDCWLYTLQQGHTGNAPQNNNNINPTSAYYNNPTTSSANNQNPTIYIPDILILFAVAKDYRDLRIRQKQKIIKFRRKRVQEQQQQQMMEQEQKNTKSETATASDDDEVKDNNKKFIENNIEPLQLSSTDRRIVWTMAVLSYRMYDSYQKKGVVQRDTIHRFLTDVYGEDSYKHPKTKSLLDIIFYVPKNQQQQQQLEAGGNDNINYLHATVSEQQFSKRVLDTVRLDDIMRTHLLLDWIALLACSMIPSPQIPDSVGAYLETMQHHETKAPVCQVYNLAENRLYEIKRRFHSMVAKSTASTMSVIQGHPMTADGTGPSDAPSDNNSTTNANSNNNNNNATTSNSGSNNGLDSVQSGSGGGSSNKVITGQYFVQAVSSSNEEVGSGGYLPPSLAKLVFQAGCSAGSGMLGRSSNHGSNNSGGGVRSSSTTDLCLLDNYYNNITGWGLYNVLQFGCMAVRHDSSRPQDPDIPLLRFLFNMFQLAVPHSYTEQNPVADKRILTRSQVTKMLQLLVEYAVFRRRADCPPIELDDEDDEDDDNKEQQGMINAVESYESNTKVDLAACLLLGLIPPEYKPDKGVETPKKGKRPKRGTVPLEILVDYVFDGNAVKDQMTFDEFCTWHSTKMTEIGPRTRLGPLMAELRLIAAVQFGIPPVLASMEITLIQEIERRHKLRYPQTDVSRRGPRGTVWHIIDALWFTSWANHVKKTAGTPQDNQDGRGNINNPDRSRSLNRIRNASLLVDNGSLALRPDIRWKHDYEILPPLAWSALQAWYDGGPPIFRSVVKYVATSTTSSSPHSAVTTRGMIPTENEIELYPLFVTVYLCDAASRGEARPFQQNFQLSRVSAIIVMLVQLCKELDVNPDHARLWVMGNKKTDASSSEGGASLTSALPTSLSSSLPSSPASDDGSHHSSRGHVFSPSDDWILDLDQSIMEQMKRRGTSNKDNMPIALLLELKDRETGLWPRGVDGKEWAFRREKSGSGGTASEHSMSDLGDGVVGLYNMGNTCYLNSSVQCLSHTPIFREYFTSKAYLRDINTTNPLGHEGRLAQVTAMLINSLWKRFNNQANDPTHNHKRVTAPGSYALVTAPALTPKTFKDSLGKFNEHFQGNEQHDAQELLAFILGGLSEDLNRIVDKPYIEAPDSDGRPDSELADIWWSNHLKREMSIIVALFTGQYKSLLTCRTCKYESARFEPFSFLQVPLPEDDNLTVTLILYPLKEYASPMKYCVRVRNDGKLRDVLSALAKVLHQDELEENDSTKVTTVAATVSQKSTVSDDGDDTEASSEDESIYIRRSQNLAVVDMRDGYISKIAPNSWLLQDLQNKDTGELPLLHVFELDPLYEDSLGLSKSVSKEAIDVQNDTSEEVDAKKLVPQKPKQAYIAIAQRRSELTSSDYLHPLVHRVFGTPLLLRIHDLENCTGRALYDIVARRLKNVVPSSVHRFLSPPGEPPTDSAVSDESSPEPEEAVSGSLISEDDDKSLQEVCTSVFRTTTDMEEVSAGPVPRYGFRLRITSRDGRRCLSCPWYECCIGCLVPDDDKPTVVLDGDSAVVDWHFAVDVATNGFGLRPNVADFGQSSSNTRQPRSTSTVKVKNHSSCGTGVNKKNMLQQPGAVTLEECLDAFAKEEKIPEAYCSKCKDFRVQTKRMSLWRLPPIVIIHLKRFQFTQHMRRKLRDLVVFPIEGLDLSRIMATPPDAAATKKKEAAAKKRVDDEDEKKSEETGAKAGEFKDDGRSEMLYDLYGVVHHQGALSGGHYVASLKSELDGQFRLFNDAQIYEIHARDVVDASAYILFYIRRDVAKAKLADVWNVGETGSTGISEEEMDQMIKGRSDRCVIS